MHVARVEASARAFLGGRCRAVPHRCHVRHLVRPTAALCSPMHSSLYQRRPHEARTNDVVVRASADDAPDAQLGEAQDLGPQGPEPRDDDVLPIDLANAVSEAANATAAALSRGVTRCEVEILLPEFWDPISGPIFPNRGDQERFWKITRRFVEELAERTGARAKAVYPDAGVAVMLSYQWAERKFGIASLNDRRPVTEEDELVIVACADPPGADDCIKVVRRMANQDEEAGRIQRPVVVFNQRLASGDVGLGLNARRMRNMFLKDFTITYSLRPIGDDGTVFRKYPGLWQVFLTDPAVPGRYKLVAEQASRPQGEALDLLVQKYFSGGQNAAGGSEDQPAGFLDQLRATANSLRYFMKSLSQ